jgi:dolichol-phosphate mannosyltransferase
MRFAVANCVCDGRAGDIRVFAKHELVRHPCGLRIFNRRLKMACDMIQSMPVGEHSVGDPSPAGRAVSLTIVMPAYNEEEAIREAVAEVRECVFAVVADAELIVVNDGSRDATGQILDELAAEDSRIKPLHQKNGGHGAALRAGLQAAQGDRLLLLDSDRQIALDRFGEHWLRSETVDAVFGVRAVRHDPALRLVLTRIVRLAMRLLFGVRVRDANVPYKIVSRHAWTDAAAYIPPATLAPSLFLALYLKKTGRQVEDVEIEHRPRLTGVSIRRWRLLKFCAKAFLQLIGFRLRLIRVRRSKDSAVRSGTDGSGSRLAAQRIRTPELDAR